MRPLSRRGFLFGAGAGSLGVLGGRLLERAEEVPAALAAGAAEAAAGPAHATQYGPSHEAHGTVGRAANPWPAGKGMDPAKFLTTFDTGAVTRLPNGRVQREYRITALDAEIQVAPGVWFPAWTYNGTVPGPTLRCTVGDALKIHFFNEASHPHTIHFHGIHPANMDGVFEQVPPGGRFTYEFPAEPFGAFLYHCHTMPVKKHIHKGLYGAFIVDPPTPRPKATEFVMVMNGFDTDLDGENEFYTVNGVANYYAERPIPLKVGEPVRIYLVNVTEFDLINSFHLHANMFRLYRTGTSLTHYELTDTVMLCQGERCLLEFTYRTPGRYMFHAHQSEFAELGWMGFFDVTA
ncbi:MAG: multicopper oxidase domain-containing protein [candidate division NC10 bacterium]|nr:multicopper oxidase domain-containing protein [candidate division NC10 bacterium]